jgi:hypothetical protein
VLKQGDPISATKFSVVVDVILKQLDLRGIVPTCLKQHSAYADDIMITTRTNRALITTRTK